MQTVIQEETTGCGIASVANILGKSYPEMKQINRFGLIRITSGGCWRNLGLIHPKKNTPFQHGITFLTWLFYLLNTTTKMERTFGTGLSLQEPMEKRLFWTQPVTY